MSQLRDLDKHDYELIQAAQDVIKKNYKYMRNHIGAAVRTKAGNIYAAVQVGATVGRISVCGEAMAMGKSISEGEDEFETIVAVRHPHQHEEIKDYSIVLPCGMCRELISDYSKNADVIIPHKGRYVKVNVMELIPEKYMK